MYQPTTNGSFSVESNGKLVRQTVLFTLIISSPLCILVGHGITAFWRGAESFEYRRLLDDRNQAIEGYRRHDQERTEAIANFCNRYAREFSNSEGK